MKSNRPVTLFTGQWADLPLETLAQKAAAWGYDGLELACWGDHVDVARAAKDKAYAQSRKEILAKYGLKLFAISNHLAGQLVCDLNDDERSDMFAPKSCHGNAEAKRKWAIQAMKDSAMAAKNIGVKVVNGFTGSSIWHMIYSFPPVSDKMVEDGFQRFAKLWNPILDVFDKCGVKFALEVHPTEIAFDIVTARHALKAIGNRKAFGFNFDPSHLHWQMVDPVKFLLDYGDRVVFLHLRDQKKDKTWVEAMGEGEMDYAAIRTALEKIKFTGDAVIELAHPRDFKPTRPLRESLKISRQFVKDKLGY